MDAVLAKWDPQMRKWWIAKGITPTELHPSPEVVEHRFLG